MPQQQFTYKGHIIVTDEDAQPMPLLKIDDKHFHVHKFPGAGPNDPPLYHSHAWCYTEYPSLLELGKGLINTKLFEMARHTHP
jgi:hypothetical protein